MINQVLGTDLRKLMRHVPSPVTVLTFAGEDGPRGVTIGSFTSVSLDPPLISFNLMNGGQTYSSLSKAAGFAIHILKEDQVHISERFATPNLSSNAQYENIDYDLSQERIPIIKNSIALLICEVFDGLTAGDHTLVIGRVNRSEIIEPGVPLLYYQQTYYNVGDPI